MFTSKVVILFTLAILGVTYLVWKLFLQGIPESINKDIESGNSVVLLFSAKWCSTCKDQDPIYEEVKKEFSNINFYDVTTKMNRVEQKLMFKKYEIHGIPTFILYNNNKEVERLVGLQSPTILKEKFSLIN